MAEKGDDITPPSPPTLSQFPPVIDPSKPAIMAPATSRPGIPESLSGATIVEQPTTKEGFDYWNHLPYAVESEETRLANLNDIIADLYAYIKAGDFESGARIASRQIKRWLHLKFKMPQATRRKLAKLYYDLSLTPGIDPSAADSFASSFKLLARYVTGE